MSSQYNKFVKVLQNKPESKIYAQLAAMENKQCKNCSHIMEKDSVGEMPSDYFYQCLNCGWGYWNGVWSDENGDEVK